MRWVLIGTAGAIGIFSGVMLLKINSVNAILYNTCEEREYTDHLKIEQVPLSAERRQELINERRTKQEKLDDTESLSYSFGKNYWEKDIQHITGVLAQGYEDVRVPDEEKREWDRQEVRNAEQCFKDQELAKKRKPDLYRTLYIGDGLIIVLGSMLAFATKKR